MNCTHQTLLRFFLFLVLMVSTSVEQNGTNSETKSGIIPYNVESQIIQMILGKVGIYNSRSRPVKTAENMRVLLVLNIGALDLDEQKETLEIFAWIQMVWIPDLPHFPLNWQHEEHFPSVSLIGEGIWTPIIHISNSIDADNTADNFDTSKTRLYVFHSGLYYVEMKGAIKSICRLKMTYFPFDRQACYIEFSLANYDSRYVEFYYPTGVDVLIPKSDVQWYISTTREETYHLNGHSKHRSILYISRKPTYYVLSLLAPTVTNCLLAPVVHMMRQETDEKLTLQVTLLMSYVVMQFNIFSYIPQSSDHLPILAIYIFVVTTLTAISLIITIILQHIHLTDDRPTPRAIESLTLESLLSLKIFYVNRFRKLNTVGNQEQVEVSGKKENTGEIKPHLEKISKYDFVNPMQPSLKKVIRFNYSKEFRLMTRRLDKYFSYLFWILVLTATSVLFALLILNRNEIIEPLDYYKEMEVANNIYNNTFGYYEYYDLYNNLTCCE